MNPIRSNFRPVHGGSLVPDYSNANRLAMGIAQQIKTEKIQQAEQEEAQQLTQMLSGQRMEEALSNPESRAQWLQLYGVDKDAAAGLMDVWKAGNELEIQQATAEAAEAQHTYKTLEDLTLRFGINESKKFLRETIIERDVAGKPTDKLKNLLVMAPDDYDAGVQTGKALAGGAVTVLSPASPVTLADGAELRDPTTGRLIATNEKDIAPEKPENRFGDITTLRKEFAAETKPFLDVNDAYGRIKASASDPSPAGDLALIFNYMKVLDPGSTVREGEFANAQNSGSVGTRIMATYNNVVNGERLTDEQRQDFVSRADKLYGQAVKTHKKREEQYIKLAKTNGFDPEQVVLDRIIFSDTPQNTSQADTLRAEAEAAIAAGANPDAVNARLEQALQGL